MPIVCFNLYILSRFFLSFLLAHFFLIIYLLKELFLRVCLYYIPMVLIGSPTFHISYELLIRFTAVISKCGHLTNNISITWGFVGDAKSYASRKAGYQGHHLGEA